MKGSDLCTVYCSHMKKSVHSLLYTVYAGGGLYTVHTYTGRPMSIRTNGIICVHR